MEKLQLKLRLYGTPLSHFTRKVRILLAELGVDFEFVRAPGVLAASTTTYGDNPLMRVPTLVHGDETVLDSDHIARYVVGRYDPSDRFGVRSDDVRDLNRLAVVNGIMANEVVLILAKRGGLADIESVAYFRKLATAIDTGLAWLDDHTDPDAARFDYGDIVTICMWQHVTHYGIARGLDRYSRVAARVARFAERPSIAGTAPEISLAEAAAAGWTPS
jgi:glutathione S-transferase